ncbi:unnamed protein product [Symbiodinium sp. CCMP2592]|nr:unnamed protein product [Symbiodinium sp. CCMP2592]
MSPSSETVLGRPTATSEVACDFQDPIPCECANASNEDVNDGGQQLAPFYIAFINQMEATRPEILRGVRVGKLLRYLPSTWLLGGDFDTLHSLSQQTPHFDQFWSHSWRGGRWSKYINILYLHNCVPATVAGSLSASVVCGLVSAGLLVGRWCLFSGLVAFCIVLLLWRPRKLVFIDIACIPQADQDRKGEAILSMGAFLKQSASMLVLWDPSWVTRLWCIFEIAAFLHSRGPGCKADLEIIPPLLGPVLLGCEMLLCVTALAYGYIESSLASSEEPVLVGEESLLLLAVLGPLFSFVTHALRGYARSVETLQEQLREFKVEHARSACCDQGHEDKSLCDREVILECITAWYSSLDNFESQVQSEVRMAIIDQLAYKAISYQRIVLLSTPYVWIRLEYAANRPSDPSGQIADLAQTFTYLLAIFPLLDKLCFRLCYRWRARCRGQYSDFLLSNAIVVVNLLVYIACYTIQIYVFRQPERELLLTLISMFSWWTVATQALPPISPLEATPQEVAGWTTTERRPVLGRRKSPPRRAQQGIGQTWSNRFLRMGVQIQIFQGLGTCPAVEHDEFTQRSATHVEHAHVRPKNKLLGGARSSRSQLRGETRCVGSQGEDVSLGARVDMPPLGVSGATLASASVANERGFKAGSINVVDIHSSRIKKRSLKRAIARAERQGTSNYKGKQLFSASLSSGAGMRPTRETLKQRVGVLSWNCGGLSELLFAEIKLYLRQHPEVHILLLQETHRSNLQEWSEDGWTFVGSPCAKPRSGGVMLGIREDFCSRDTLRWQELVPGRLLQARCFAQGQHLDILGVYQHTLPFGSAELARVLQLRWGLWDKLDTALRSLPTRSSIIVAGDLNSGLEKSPPCTGGGVLPHNQTAEVVSERKWLTGLLQKHQLCALNTWGRKSQSHTFFHSKGKSQIDFILVRSVLADSAAKRCVPKVAPIAGWRSSGHLLLQAMIPLRWTPWRLSRGARGCSEPLHRELPAIADLRRDIQAQNPVSVPSVQKPGLRGLDGEIVHFWEARKQLAAQRVRTMRDAFHRLRLFLQLRRRHRELRALARARRRQQLLDILELAESAARKGDSKGLFQCVRWLSPRKARRSIRLRDADGNVMHPRAECKMLAVYAAELFKARSPEHICSVQLQPIAPQIFRPEAWQAALLSMRSGKAVPNGEPQVQAWKNGCAEAAHRLSEIAQASLCGDQPHIPSDWSWVQLAWLAKAGKTPSSPENLRSIGLMPVDAKAFLIVLRNEISSVILSSMRSTPQYAYRPGTSTADPLLRATLHCSAVRTLLKQHQHDHTSKLLGEATEPLIGGLMISLDLRKAFDAVPHSEILASLLEAGVGEAIAVLLVGVHAQTRCFVQHGGASEAVRMTRGLRQGCPIAPIIFAAWTARMHRRLGEALREKGRRLRDDRYSLFADDLHAHWLLRDVAGFRLALDEIRLLIDTLGSLGMSINFQKSLIVLRLRGSAVARACRSILVWRDGGQHVRIRSGSQDYWIPTAATMPYLGAVLSYDSFEQQTFAARAQVAQQRFQELGRVLRTRGALTQRQRARLYQATVWPCLAYSLVFVGVTMPVYKGCVSVLAGHYRKILRIYEEGVSNVQVLTRAEFTPAVALRDQLARKVDSIRADCGRSAELKAPELARAVEVLDQLDRVLEVPLVGVGSSLEPLVVALSSACPVCGVYFDSEASVQMHIMHRHPEINTQAKLSFRKDVHSLFGLPFCRFCQGRLFDWRSLERHITTGTCFRVKSFLAEGLTEDQMLERIREEEIVSPPVPPAGAQGQETVTCQIADALRVAPAQLGAGGSRLRVLATRCALCRQWVKEAGKIKAHWRQSHPEQYRKVKVVATAEARSLSAVFVVPCRFCGSRAKNELDHSGKCSALFQLLAVRQLRGLGMVDSISIKGPAAKQWQSTPQYQLFEVGSTPIGRAFGPGLKAASSSASTMRPPKVAVATSTLQVPSGVVVGPSPVLESGWLLRLRLSNGGNLCFMNAVIHALLFAMQGADGLGNAIQGFYRLAEQAVSRNQALALSGQLIVRSVLRRWSFDGRQHDASEFASVLLRGLGFSLARWEARYQRFDQVRTPQRGVHPIAIPIGLVASPLQDLISQWFAQEFRHALIEVPSLLILQIERCGDGHKVHTPVAPSDCVQVPVFTEGVAVRWHDFQVAALIEHQGETLDCGHYRAVLRMDSSWWHADDSSASVRVEFTLDLQRRVYLALLVPARADVESDAGPIELIDEPAC